MLSTILPAGNKATQVVRTVDRHKVCNTISFRVRSHQVEFYEIQANLTDVRGRLLLEYVKV